LGFNLYSKIFKKVIKVSSIENAEMTKIYENVFRSVNIGLVNEMKKITSKMDMDINEIIKHASTKPYGFFPFYPGPGLGGHCIPIDPFYLSWKAQKIGIKTEFIELAGKINRSMPDWIFSKINSHFKKKIKNKKCLLIGLAYKKDIGDCRESPTFEMMNILKKNSVKFEYYDPYIKKIPKTRNYSFNNKSVELTKKNLEQFDFVIILTNHSIINYNNLARYSKIIFDTRNSFKNDKSKKIIKC
jgi:UDP-N-acetyl-D-glucosamine dehydrogenase